MSVITYFDHLVLTAPRSEADKKFLQAMLDRMAVSFAKYGSVREAYPHKVDALASLEKRLAKYRKDGNTEWLIDVANFAMIEFMHPSHERAHFRPTDSRESPGRKWRGEPNPHQEPNDPAQQRRRG